MTKQYNYGFQDYSFPPYTHENPMPNKWSGCSNDDFMAAYQLFKSRDGTYCLEERVPPKGIILSRPHSGHRGPRSAPIKLNKQGFGPYITQCFLHNSILHRLRACQELLKN